MKKENGVTLVALVVTIIVLIILAGISINLILGDNGIITIAKRAKENTELAKVEEETELNELYEQLISEGSSSENLPYDSIAKLTEFKTAIANAINEAGGVKTDISVGTAVFAENIKGILKEATKNATATAKDITEGNTAWVNGNKITGTMEKFAGKTVTASTIKENGENAEITIPSAGYYDIDSKVSIPVKTIKDEISSISNNLNWTLVINLYYRCYAGYGIYETNTNTNVTIKCIDGNVTISPVSINGNAYSSSVNVSNLRVQIMHMKVVSFTID